MHSALVEDRKSVALVDGKEELYLLVERVDGGSMSQYITLLGTANRPCVHPY